MFRRLQARKWAKRFYPESVEVAAKVVRKVAETIGDNPRIIFPESKFHKDLPLPELHDVILLEEIDDITAGEFSNTVDFENIESVDELVKAVVTLHSLRSERAAKGPAQRGSS